MSVPVVRYAPPNSKSDVPVSVALCTFNGEQFLQKQLKSIADQASQPAELIVCDDGSTDQTVQLIERFRRDVTFPVRIIKNDTRLGIVRNFEKAIHECRGEIIALSDQDDIWIPDKLSTILTFFRSHRTCTAIFSDAELINQDGKSMGRRLSQAQGYAHGKLRRLLVRGQIADILFRRNICTGATMAIRSELRQLALPFPRPMPAGLLHDGWVALVAAIHQQLAYVKKVLIKYRQHGSQNIGAELIDVSSMLQRVGWKFDERQQYLRQLEMSSHNLFQIVRARFGNTAGVELFEQYISYLGIRSGLPHQRARRMKPILQQILNGNYLRYSSGILSAIRDLL